MKTEMVTTLKRQATRLIAAVRRGKAPVLITEHGRPAAVLVDVESYDRQQARMKMLEGIARGERAIREGRVATHAEAKRRLKRWLA